MEGVLAIILIFGGAAATAISFSPVGRAIADRIRGARHAAEPDPQLLDEVHTLRLEVQELAERLDFAERMLAKPREAAADRIAGGA